MTAGAAAASPPPAPWRSPSPRRNQPCGVSRDRVANASGAWALGANVPPMIASVMPTAAVADPAASCDDANEITSAETPSAATIAPRIRATTPSGGPQSAPMSSVVATTRVSIAITLVANAPISLPTRMVPGPTGAARIREQRPLAPLLEHAEQARLRREEQEQDRHRGAEEGGQVERAELGRDLDDGDRRGRRARRLGDPLLVGRRQRRAGERGDRRDRQLGAGDALAEARGDGLRDSVASPLVRDPTTASVVGCPDSIAAVKPCGMTNAVSASPASTIARAAASVGTSNTSATPDDAIDPMTSLRSTIESSPPSRSATTHFAWNSAFGPISRLKISASPSGAMTAKISADRSRKRCRRSLAAIRSAMRNGDNVTPRCRARPARSGGGRRPRDRARRPPPRGSRHPRPRLR